MNVGSLFSGIGGIELGFSREGFETKWFIENNPYCQAILRKNFPNIANKGLNVVLENLAENGYDAEWFCLRAQDFGALHRRERLFIVAYPSSTRMERDDECGLQNIGREEEQVGKREFERRTSSNNHEQRLLEIQAKECAMERQEQALTEDRPCVITHDGNERIQRFCAESLQGQQGFSWCQDVRRIEDLQGRVDIPQPLFRGGRDGIPAWVDRIKCCGNAVVPQVAQFIARRIKEIEGVK